MILVVRTRIVIQIGGFVLRVGCCLRERRRRVAACLFFFLFFFLQEVAKLFVFRLRLLRLWARSLESFAAC